MNFRHNPTFIAITRGISGEGSSTNGGTVERLPQASASGAPASVTTEMQNRLLNLSEDIGETVQITSGVRTPSQNSSVGGARTSSHLTTNGDQAADIQVQGNTAAQTADAAHGSGQFNRVNEYTNGRGVHVDLRSTGNQGRFTDWAHRPR